MPSEYQNNVEWNDSGLKTSTDVVKWGDIVIEATGWEDDDASEPYSKSESNQNVHSSNFGRGDEPEENSNSLASGSHGWSDEAYKPRLAEKENEWSDGWN